MSRPIFSDIESPAMKSQEIDNLKTNSKRTGICTAVAFVFGFIGFWPCIILFIDIFNPY